MAGTCRDAESPADDPVGQARSDPRQQRELPHGADTDLLAVAFEAADDRVGDLRRRELWNVEAPRRAGVDDGRQHVEDANAALLELGSERAGERVHRSL